MLPFTKLGYHTVPSAVKSCTLCHEKKSLDWANTHAKHRSEVSCTSCHSKQPTGLVQARSILCSSCHDSSPTINVNTPATKKDVLQP